MNHVTENGIDGLISAFGESSHIDNGKLLMTDIIIEDIQVLKSADKIKALKKFAYQYSKYGQNVPQPIEIIGSYHLDAEIKINVVCDGSMPSRIRVNRETGEIDAAVSLFKEVESMVFYWLAWAFLRNVHSEGLDGYVDTDYAALLLTIKEYNVGQKDLISSYLSFLRTHSSTFNKARVEKLFDILESDMVARTFKKGS